MNNHFEDIEKLWKSAPQEPLPDAGQLVKKAGDARKKTMRRWVVQLIALMSFPPVGIWILCTIHFKYIITYIAVILMFITVLGYVAARLRQARMLSRLDLTQTPLYTLQQAEKLYASQQWLLTKGTLLYVVSLNIAFALYFYEVLIIPPGSVWFKILFLTLYTGWFIFSFLVIGKKQKQKELARSKSLVDALRQLKDL